MAKGLTPDEFWDKYAGDAEYRTSLTMATTVSWPMPVSECKEADLRLWASARASLRQHLRWFRAPLQLARVTGRRGVPKWRANAAVGAYWERMRQAHRWLRGGMPAMVTEYLETLDAYRRAAKGAP